MRRAMKKKVKISNKEQKLLDDLEATLLDKFKECGPKVDDNGFTYDIACETVEKIFERKFEDLKPEERQALFKLVLVRLTHELEDYVVEGYGLEYLCNRIIIQVLSQIVE